MKQCTRILTITSGGVLAVGTGFALNGPLTASGGTIQTLAPINFPRDIVKSCVREEGASSANNS